MPRHSAPVVQGHCSGGITKQEKLAERARFELAGDLRPHMISSHAPSGVKEVLAEVGMTLAGGT